MRGRLPAMLACLFGAGISLLGACNALTGAGDLGIRDTDSGILTTDGGTDPLTDASGDGGTPVGDGGGPGDASIVVITPSLAACGTGRVCLADTAGWSPALQPLTTAPGSACPTDWPTMTTSKRSGGGRCECNCAPDVDTCGGNIALKTGATCAGVMVTAGFVTDGGCTASSTAIPNPASLTASGTPPKACKAAVVDNLDHSPDDIVTCSGAMTTMSMSCKSGEVCVPKPVPGMFGLPSGSLCMAHDGEANCPLNLPNRVVTGTAIADGRTCGPSCACAPRTTCNGGTVESFTNDACTGSSRKYSVDGTCLMVTSNNPLGYRYTTDLGCAVTTPAQVVGKETIAGPRTFCCAGLF